MSDIDTNDKQQPHPGADISRTQSKIHQPQRDKCRQQPRRKDECAIYATRMNPRLSAIHTALLTCSTVDLRCEAHCFATSTPRQYASSNMEIPLMSECAK